MWITPPHQLEKYLKSHANRRLREQPPVDNRVDALSIAPST
jgi:hypothetical protein